MNENLDKKSIRAMQIDGIEKVKEYYELIDKMPKSEFLVVREDVNAGSDDVDTMPRRFGSSYRFHDLKDACAELINVECALLFTGGGFDPEPNSERSKLRDEIGSLIQRIWGLCVGDDDYLSRQYEESGGSEFYPGITIERFSKWALSRGFKLADSFPLIDESTDRHEVSPMGVAEVSSSESKPVFEVGGGSAQLFAVSLVDEYLRTGGKVGDLKQKKLLTWADGNTFDIYGVIHVNWRDKEVEGENGKITNIKSLYLPFKRYVEFINKTV